ncbi:MAG: 30S ribosome-binding factor RbfA [Planctomycetes bacterium]|nr:30S ribosome-binding factor RbfA [Planctomycetota bacterium]
MPVSRRGERLSREFLRELSRIILFEMKDPRLGFITITKVEISPDYRSAKVLLSILGDEVIQHRTLSALKHARGFIQKELCHNLRLKHIPELFFQIDKDLVEAMRVSELLNAIEKENAQETPGAEPDAENESESED